MALPDLTGQNIQDTYQRILQVSSSGEIADGTGSLYVPPTASFAISASYAASSSYEIEYEISSSYTQTASHADNFFIKNSLTASGNISSSGTITANKLYFRGEDSTSNYLEHNGTGLHYKGSAFINSHITASGDISASGAIIASTLTGTINGGTF